MSLTTTALPARPVRSARARALAPLLIAIGLSAAALLLRLHDLTVQSLWWDEVSSFQQARLDWDGLFAATAADNYPPLHNILLHLSMQVFGPNAFALRLPSALLGAASVPALYWAGSLIAGRPAALIAAALLAVSGFHLWYSQEARMYALLCLTTILYAGTATQFTLRAAWRWGVASALCGALLLYSHPYGALEWVSLAFAIGLFTLSRQGGGLRPAARFVLTQIPALLLYLPWALILLGRAKILAAAGFWLPPVTPSVLLYYFEALLTGRGLFATLLVALGLITLPAMRAERGRILEIMGTALPPLTTNRAAVWVLIAWGLLPAALAVVISAVSMPMLFHRYLIGSLPALLLLIGMGFSRLPKSALGLVSLLMLGTAAIVGLFHSSPGERDDFRDVAAYLAGATQPGDCVVMSPESAIAMAYYRPAGFDCLATTRRPATASFGGARARRILIIATATDQATTPYTGGLGRTVATKRFGVTSLLLITPN